MAGECVPMLRHLPEAGDGRGRYRVILQPQGILRLDFPALSHPQDSHLLELLELLVRKAPDCKIVEVIAEDAADVRGEPVIGDNIDEKAAIDEPGTRPLLRSGTDGVNQGPHPLPGAFYGSQPGQGGAKATD